MAERKEGAFAGRIKSKEGGGRHAIPRAGDIATLGAGDASFKIGGKIRTEGGKIK